MSMNHSATRNAWRSRQNQVLIACIAAIAVLAAMLFASPPAAASAAEQPAPMNGSVALGAEDVELTAEQWDAAIQELIASEAERTVEASAAGTSYAFQIPVDPAVVPGGVFELGVFVPSEAAEPQPGVITPYLGWGQDSRGPYLILNQFDQDLLTTGAIHVIGLAACALPGIGWVSCGVIQAALAVASVALSQQPSLCPDQVRLYLFQEYNRVVCH